MPTPSSISALMYAKGRGVPQDDAEAAKWYRRAADQGVARAQYNLGRTYDEGQGVPQDYVEAVKWYRRAADQGDADAQLYLSGMYAKGRGVPQDFTSAYMWLSLSVTAGHQDATEGLDAIAGLMTPKQITTAQKLARQWRPEHPFRVAIVCAMWLTGFDVECLSTLYIDKPMKAHTLMQAIARANRVYPGKDFGLIVDYNGMLASLRAALAQYALGDDGAGGEEIVAPIEERVQALHRSHRGDRGASARSRLRSRVARWAPRASRASRVSLTRSTPSIRATRPSGGSRYWRGRSSSASRRC